MVLQAGCYHQKNYGTESLDYQAEGGYYIHEPFCQCVHTNLVTDSLYYYNEPGWCFDLHATLYITSEANKERLQLPTERKEKINMFKNIGSNKKLYRSVMWEGWSTDPLMCKPINKHTCESSQTYLHLHGLELSDPASSNETPQADMLVSSNHCNW